MRINLSLLRYNLFRQALFGKTSQSSARPDYSFIQQISTKDLHMPGAGDSAVSKIIVISHGIGILVGGA